MDIFTIIFWVIAVVLFVVSLMKNRNKTLAAMKKSKSMMGGMVGEIIAIIFLIGLVLTFIPPESIKTVLGSSNTFLSTVISAAVGSVTLIPAFVAFPLVGSLVDAGASIVPAVAFLTTLTMVGVVTFPLEKKEFGTKFAVTRNLFSFGFAIVIALAMGVVV
ncbi:permease [Anaerobium acetethylicum]|uniref:Predicted permease n=1 Tax=Anaerobium acetethylicum TaxID=1619234 RepID=A0A1D3TYI2_9FIRM|nr:permease [Anaerobium acetethylicum]SCP99506.1 Predicted permease [Anaerobium acetethylicum]